jgi:cell division protein FtsB
MGHQMTQTRSSGTRRAPARGRRARRPQLHMGRFALLVLVLIAAAFYVSPLRAFFAQQDRYQHEVSALRNARADNAAMELQIKQLSTRSYIAQIARADSTLVPPGTQLFVVKGLPGKSEEDAYRSPAPRVTQGSFSVLDRVEDLWRTLLH